MCGLWNFHGNVGNGIFLLHLEFNTELETQTFHAVTSLIKSSGNEIFVLCCTQKEAFPNLSSCECDIPEQERAASTLYCVLFSPHTLLVPSLLDRSQCSISRGYSVVIFRVQHTVLILDDSLFHATFWCSPQVFTLSTQKSFAAPDSTSLQFCPLCGWHIKLLECRWHRTPNISESCVWGFSAVIYSWKERML